MKTYYIMGRRTSPLMYTQVEAESREDAIHAAIAACPPEEQIEVLQVQEGPFFTEGPTGMTGPTGATGASGVTGAARHR